MKTIQLDWKEFNVNLQKIQDLCKLVDSDFYGISANSKLELHFSDSVADQDIDDITDHWNSLTEKSEEAVTYKSAAELDAEKKQKKISAKNKLLALGLSEEEVSAMLGA